MKIWFFNQSDYTLIGKEGSEAPTDPMRNSPKVPRGATLKEPPEFSENEIPVWNDPNWEIVSDYRGYVYYDVQGARTEIYELGVTPPANAITSPRPSKYHEWDGFYWVENEELRLEEWRRTTSVTRFQAKAALDDAQLLETVETYMSDPNTSKRTKLAWAEASFERDSNLVNSIGTELGLTDADIDNLFIAAKEIKV